MRSTMPPRRRSTWPTTSFRSGVTACTRRSTSSRCSRRDALTFGLALIEHLILRLDRASIDDSDGGLAEAFGRIEPLHARTASAHGEDPNALADRLVQFAHTLDVEPFDNAVTTHGDVLGRTGLSAIIISSAEARRAAGSGDAVLDRLIADARAALREGA